MKIKGSIDNETRCAHYHGENDRIAIKFYCCKDYFSCFQCHDQYGCGEVKVWPREDFDKEAIICGSCNMEITINQYLTSGYSCPSCGAKFNPGCSLHYHLYFAR